MARAQESGLDSRILIESQPDMSSVKPVMVSPARTQTMLNPPVFYRVRQDLSEGKVKRWVQVLDDLRSYYSVKRHRDLLHYLNRFPSFVPFYEIRRVKMHYLLFLEAAGKRLLPEWVAEKGNLSSRQAERFLKASIKGLGHLHEAGFVHANIRPESVLVGNKGKHFHLMDWRMSMPAASGYETECLPVECRYTPPERLKGIHNEKSDIYQLGCTLYFALTGKHIHRLDKVEDPFDQMWAQVHHSIRKINHLPIFWRYLIIWVTQKNPEKRPDLKALKQWLKAQTVPKWVRELSMEPVDGYPKDSLAALADEHYDYARYQLARRYEKAGQFESAFNLYENGSAHAYSLSEYRLGLFYLKGVCVDQSITKAIHHLKNALRKGHPGAAFYLGQLYEKGLSVRKDSDKALKLFEFSAQRGHLQAQYELGIRLLESTPEKHSKGLGWLKLAAHYGHSSAGMRLKQEAG